MVEVDVVVFASDDASAVSRARDLVAARADLRTIACLPDAGPWPGACGAVGVAVRADGYASNARSFADALAHVTAESRAARHTGPLRLTALGALGMVQYIPQPGATFALVGERTTIGRARSCDVRIPQGHSDQSNVAPVHARVIRDESGVLVRDCASTNGTYVRGVRVVEARLTAGEEIAICGLLRLRLDGAL